MRNHILPIAIAFVVAAPCTAFAGEKKTIEVNSFSFGATNSGSGISSGGGSGRIGPDKIQHKHIGGVKYEDVQTQPKAPTTGKPLNTTVNPALQGNVLEKGAQGTVRGVERDAQQKVLKLNF
jgi:hypothetical protein